MDLQKIEILIEKYLEGKTTLKEEALLGNFFQMEEVPTHLMPYKDLFAFFSKERETAIAPLKQLAPWETPKSSLRDLEKQWWHSKWTNVAVVLILFSGSFFSGRQYYQKKQAEIAYNQTLSAFSLLAQNYQKATASAVYLNEFEQAKTKIYNPNNK